MTRFVYKYCFVESKKNLKMLELLVANKLSSTFILIEDSTCAKGEDLLLSFLTQHAQDTSVKEISLLCFENPVSYYSEKCGDSKIFYWDCFTNLNDWQSNITTSLDNHVVFIDSLSVLIILQDFPNLYRYLFNLSNKAKKVVILIHGDAITDKEKLSQLNFLATTVIKINKLNNFESKTVEIRHKKLGGKVVRQREEYSIDSDFKLTAKAITSKKKEIINTSENVKSEMKNISTFDIGLNMSESEKLAKSKLILPYMRNETEEGSGKIIYEPDAGDDLEEDPDDDLDI